jgi:hypothetical protein
MNIKAPHYHEKGYSPILFFKARPRSQGMKFIGAELFFMVVGCFYILYY